MRPPLPPTRVRRARATLLVVALPAALHAPSPAALDAQPARPMPARPAAPVARRDAPPDTSRASGSAPRATIDTSSRDAAARSAPAAGDDGPPPVPGRAPVMPDERTARRLRAARLAAPLRLDGRLDEADWARAPVSGRWRQVVPEQGIAGIAETEVRVLQDDAHLYVGVRARRSPGAPARPRRRNLQRDFLYPEHDAVAIMFDPFRDGRASWIFGVAAGGNVEDRAFTAGVGADAEWDVPWRARTAVTDSGWTAELAIPWRSIPAPARDSTWAFNALRAERSRNEVTMWSPVPRGTIALRSEYFGRLDGLTPPARGAGVQLQPYVLARDAGGAGPAAGGASRATLGGDVKWRPTRSAVVDLTLNTDFAQADVDRQVVNLSRFSVRFPERRPFFQEGRLLFTTGIDDRIQPLFTRRIGLDAEGRSVPIVAGARLLQRSAGGQAGLLVVRQGRADTYRTSDVAVARLARNVGARARVGAMLVGRRDAPLDGPSVDGPSRDAPSRDTARAPSREHATAAADGFVQLGPVTSVDAAVSATWLRTGRVAAGETARAEPPGNGAAGHVRLSHQGSVFGSVASVEGARAGYRPLVGFLGRTDYVRAAWGGEWDLRPAWRPAWLRRVVPGYELDAVWSASRLALEEWRARSTPVVLEWQDGARVRLGAEVERQVLARPFAPLPGLAIPAGTSDAWRLVALAHTDPSRTLAARAELTAGGYFDGRAVTLASQLAWTPDPRAALVLRHTVARLAGIGATPATPGGGATTHLVAPELRLAWSPRLQLTTFHQHNTGARQASTNVRLSWEMQPLSFLHVVWNDTRAIPGLAAAAAPPPGRELTVKLSYLFAR